MMNSQELAIALNGCEYGKETGPADNQIAKKSGLVVVFGASDDLMEFRGAVNDEMGCYEGGEAFFTRSGLLVNECDNEDCPHFKRLMKTATPIKAKWDVEGYSWVYETAIPHASFEVLEDGEKYCRGIVFALSDIPAL
jgi:hypothetical protein